MTESRPECRKKGIGSRAGLSGFSMLELIFVVTILGVIATFVIPSLLQSRIAARENSAISSVRTLANSQSSYLLTSGGGGYAPDLQTLNAAGYIDRELASGTKDGYLFAVSGGATSFRVTARPRAYGSTGVRSFYIDESGVIRYSSSAIPADSSSPAVGR